MSTKNYSPTRAYIQSKLSNLLFAFELRAGMVKMQKEYLVDIEDVVVVTSDAQKKVKLHQTVNLTAAGAVSGGFWGALIGCLFLNPILGAVAGASAGAVSGALSDVGIDDEFLKELGGTLKPNSSALFVLLRDSNEEKVLDKLKGFGGTVLRTSLKHEDEAQLQAALSAVSAESSEPAPS